VLVLVLGVLFSSMGLPEAPSWLGKVAVKGSEPFTFTALVDQNGKQWKLVGNRTSELRRTAQGRWVRVTGRLQKTDTIEVETWSWAPEENKK
jgi:hypothetical protein